MKLPVLRFFACAIFVFFLIGSAEASSVPERRKPQFGYEFGYALFPYPYSLPGIGQGLGIVGGAMNINGSTADAYGMMFGGDVKGLALGLGDAHLIPRTLILDVGTSTLTAATIQNYSKRGMKTDKNDYNNIELGDMTYYGGRLTATFFDRRFEVYGAYYQGSSQVKNIRDNNGNLLYEAQSTNVQRGHVTILGTRLDLTDDYQDPRRGFRIDIGRSLTPPSDSGPDYFQQDYNTTAYVPVGRRSTWVLNYFRSDAYVKQKGDMDRDGIALRDLGHICGSLTGQELTACNAYVDNKIANNTYGTASSLGGFNRLRSYPNGRFSGAHTVFYGTEIRWNLTEESTPYDIFVMRDIRTSWQIALYHEIGSTADKRSEVGDVWRSSTGIGLRMVTASGVVFRGDIATGKEGISPSIFIGYPWEL